MFSNKINSDYSCKATKYGMQQCLYSLICLSNQASHGLPTSVVRAEMLTFLRGVFAEMLVRS